MSDLKELLDDHIGGSPMTKRKWVRRSLRNLSDDLKECGHRASHTTVAKLLREENCSPKANRRRYAGSRHAERDCQFRHIAKLKKGFLAAGLPVISVDAKKKELIGNFKSPGSSWCREADKVNIHDFRQDASARAVPYGVYVVNQNRGYVRVGVSADTPAFAVDAIAHWWLTAGQRDFPAADRLLIMADAGGSNGCRPRLWKLHLQLKLVDRFNLKVTVCHYPTGTSQYNPIEHRLFSAISSNWAGKPLRSLSFLLASLRGTKNTKGLRVHASLTRAKYQTKIKVADDQMASLRLQPHKTCPKWNYTIKPKTNAKDKA